MVTFLVRVIMSDNSFSAASKHPTESQIWNLQKIFDLFSKYNSTWAADILDLGIDNFFYFRVGQRRLRSKSIKCNEHRKIASTFEW